MSGSFPSHQPQHLHSSSLGSIPVTYWHHLLLSRSGQATGRGKSGDGQSVGSWRSGFWDHGVETVEDQEGWGDEYRDITQVETPIHPSGFCSGLARGGSEAPEGKTA